jgi:hypothetical protein
VNGAAPWALDEVLSYDRQTGQFTWLVDVGTVKAGELAGTINADGYIQIRYQGQFYLAHRLAWRFVTGEEPKAQIDHRDRVECHNWFDNLREATNTLNTQNRGENKNNTSGFRGVAWSKAAGKWQAGIKVDGKRKHLGLFEDPVVAHGVYLAACSALHPFSDPMQ